MGDQVRTGHVEVGEVGRVGLVHVVVSLEEVGARRRDAVVKEGAVWERGPSPEDMVEEGMEDASLSSILSV